MARPEANDGAGRSGRLERIGFVCLFLVYPVFVIFSSRSATLMLALSTLLIVAGLRARGAFGEFKSRMFGGAAAPLSVVFLVASLFAAVSITWSPDPMFSLVTFWKTVGNVILIAAALAAFPLAASAGRMPLLVAGLIVGTILCMIQLHGGISLRGLIGARDDHFTVNRAIMSQALLVWPVAAYLAARAGKVAAGAIILFVATAAVTSESGAASLAMLVGLLVLYAASRWRRGTILAMAAVVVISALAMPLLVRIAADLPLHWFQEIAPNMSSSARVVLWNDFATAIPCKFWSGWGLNASRVLPIYAISDLGKLVVDLWWHPHNALLQVWIELGFFGAVLAAIGSVLGVGAVARTQEPVFPFAAAAFSGAFSATVVSHGAWENWWLSLMGMTAVAFGVLLKTEARNRRT